MSGSQERAPQNLETETPQGIFQATHREDTLSIRNPHKACDAAGVIA